MHSKKIVALAITATLMACSAPSGTGAIASPSQTKPEPRATVSSATATDARTEAATPLSNVLMAFASEAGQSWKSYDTVPGTVWLAAAPSEYAKGKYQRNGRLLLTGFGLAKLPNGKTGAEYGTVEDNEGQSGLTLAGDAEQVQMLSVKKFYFSDDYQPILGRQFETTGKVTRIADGCISEEDAEMASNPAFFEVALPGGKSVYAEVFLEEGGKYSPGYTVFDFTREEPVARIKELQCKEQ
ncbi:MAG TPA: hypothetical protein VGQ93_00360 [Lysobacter sp.]|jgi:hypothetical protein|nr:hypothetical protein [Lysobacter sp.]